MGILSAALKSRPASALASPHGVDRYLEQIHPMLTVERIHARVVAVSAESDTATTVVLRPNRAWRGFLAGQHVEFGVEVDGRRRVRVFSMSDSALRRDGLISVSVKAHPDGFVSQFLRDGLQPGTIVDLSEAKGDFVLPKAPPTHLLFLSGGSGITPVMSMLRTVRDLEASTRVTFLHYARSRADEMFSDELDTLAALPNVSMQRVYTREPDGDATLTGRFTPDHLAALGIEPATTLTFACGPAGLIESVRDLYETSGAAEQLRTEYFKVPSVDLEAGEATGTLQFDRSGAEAENTGATILEQAEAAGLEPAFGCRMGICGTCTVKKKSGAVRNVISGEVRANTDEYIKPCITSPVGDTCVDL
ncbi:MAG TPA: ferredoxin reductase [Aeromicrobium sp.]|nr:ferredoxin reductase [Aeromicrobium sp.]